MTGWRIWTRFLARFFTTAGFVLIVALWKASLSDAEWNVD
jgi:hypothetical protein